MQLPASGWRASGARRGPAQAARRARRACIGNAGRGRLGTLCMEAIAVEAARGDGKPEPVSRPSAGCSPFRRAARAGHRTVWHPLTLECCAEQRPAVACPHQPSHQLPIQQAAHSALPPAAPSSNASSAQEHPSAEAPLPSPGLPPKQHRGRSVRNGPAVSSALTACPLCS